MIEYSAARCTCERCSYEFARLPGHMPRRCPSCKSPYWQTARALPVQDL